MKSKSGFAHDPALICATRVRAIRTAHGWRNVVRGARIALGLLTVTAGGASHAAAIASTESTSPTSARDEIARLRRELAHHDFLYQQATPEISDFDYDQLKQRLTALEQANPAIAREVPPIPALGDDRSGLFATTRHRVPMLSLDKTYDEAAVRSFAARMERAAAGGTMEYMIEPKFDGFAVSVTFERGQLARAVTRGNGTEGDDITANVLRIRGLPRQLRVGQADGRPNPIPDLIELRGEIFVSFAEFERINREREAAGESRFANPRNLAAGTIRQLDAGEVERRGLQIVFYAFGACEPATALPATQREFHALIAAWGLPGVTNLWSARNADELWRAIEALRKERAAFPFPTDGAVVKVNSLARQHELGADETAPRWAIACKFAPERATTQLRAITIQVGRTGVLTPVAELVPVQLGGSTIARATLHNRDEIARRDVRIGDFVVIEKAGEIIPAIVGVDPARRPPTAVPFEFPRTCPACGTAIAAHAGEVALRCENDECPAQLRRRLEHFASREGVDIPGLGPAMIDALVERQLVKSLPDLYRLRRADLVTIPNVGEKSADQLLTAIEASRCVELWRFINGLGIPQVGTIGARELARRAGSLDQLMSMAPAPDGAGPGADRGVTAAAEYFANPRHRAIVAALIAAGVAPRSAATAGRPLAGKTFVLTGALPTLTRAAATARITAAGGEVNETVTRTTSYVVAGASPGAKLDRARSLGVTVIDEAELARLCAGP
jgi:DNA ligase (NAD+)